MHSRMGRFNQQVRQECATRHPVTLGAGSGSTFNGTLAESESSRSDSFRLTVDLNIPYVPDDGNSEVYGSVGFDVNDMIRNQHWVGGRRRSGRKRKAPEGTIGGISMSGTSRTMGDFVSTVGNAGHTASDFVNVINTSPITSESLPEDPKDLLNGISATVQPFIQSHSSSSLHPLSPQHWMTNSSFMEASSVSHIPSEDNAGSSLQTRSLLHALTASSFQSTHFTGVSWTDLLENNTSLTNFLNDILSALEYHTNGVIQPSSGPVVDLSTSGVGDLGRTANFLGHFMNNEIGPEPLPVVTGETVAADNEEMLVPAGDGVLEPGQRDNPIVIEDDEEDEREEDQPADDQISVGNMSYEELLALQDHVGYVKTGLRSRAIDALLMRHRYYAEMNDCNDSCCICLDTYKERAKLGRLDCGHEFHYRCIWKWLRSKNFCPLCKRTALKSDRSVI